VIVLPRWPWNRPFGARSASVVSSAEDHRRLQQPLAQHRHQRLQQFSLRTAVDAPVGPVFSTLAGGYVDQ
jgi:hypothetical protein